MAETGPTTIGHALAWARSVLEPEPIDAAILLTYVLGIDRAQMMDGYLKRFLEWKTTGQK